MSFTLRQVTRRAGGGEIVRTRAISAAEPLIGRGADCDVHLPDLAAGLRHARLVANGLGRVRIETIGAARVEIGGRLRTEADLALADATNIVIGSHVLSLTAGATPDEIVVSVARLEGGRNSPAVAGERAVFAPRAAVLGKRRLAWIFGLGILVFCLAAPMTAFFLGRAPARIQPDRQWSSGPLSRAHAFLAGRCVACHRQAFVAVRDDACLACHGADGGRAALPGTMAEVRSAGGPAAAARLIRDHAAYDRLLAATPLPPGLGPRIGALFQRAFHHGDQRCAACHLEHVAQNAPRPEAPLLQAPRATPFLVTRDTCVACHGELKARLPDTTLIDTPDWRRHPDFRPLINVAGAGAPPRVERIALARRPLDDTGLTFSHDFHLLAGGFVARTAQDLGAGRGYGSALGCANCHHPAADGRGFVPVEMKRDCAACHSLAFAGGPGGLRYLPHGSAARAVATLEDFYGAQGRAAPRPPAAGRRLPGLAAAIHAAWRRLFPSVPSAQASRAVRAAFAPNGMCAKCHGVMRPLDDASLQFRIVPVRMTQRYLPRGAFDHRVPAHHQDASGHATCGDCHAATQSDRAGDILLPRIAACAACHGNTRPPARVVARADCAECHGYHAPGAPAGRPAPGRWTGVTTSRIAWSTDAPPPLRE